MAEKSSCFSVLKKARVERLTNADWAA